MDFNRRRKQETRIRGGAVRWTIKMTSRDQRVANGDSGKRFDFECAFKINFKLKCYNR